MTGTGHELLLLRHGKAERLNGIDDRMRPLKDSGKRGAQRIGLWLHQQGLYPDLVISSPAERSLMSAQKCCKLLDMAADRIQQDKRLYQDDAEALMELIRSLDESVYRVMLVGHNPALEQLLQNLSTDPPATDDQRKLMKKTSLAQLRISTEWSAIASGHCRLLRLQDSSSLPKLFPFPQDTADEYRDRPAYYYTQSSVLPYRISKGRLQLLIIRSSSNKHWVAPKGIADPGHSLQQSALKEAWEEAGIEGEIRGNALGQYRYQKWGAICTVTVFAMEVTHELEETQWREKHRGRRWVSAEQAGQLLRQSAALNPMICLLQERL